MAEEIQKWSGVWIKIMPREVRINGIDQIWLVGGLYLIWRILFLIEFLVLELWKQNSLLLWRREEKRRKQKKRWEGKCERGWLHLQPNIWWGFVLVRYLIFHLHHLLHFIFKFLFFILRSSKFFSFQFFFCGPIYFITHTWQAFSCFSLLLLRAKINFWWTFHFFPLIPPIYVLGIKITW
jgi:hypothetical protein